MDETRDKDRADSRSSNGKPLTELEAAFRLGVTVALLYGYTQWGGGAGKRRLRGTTVDGQTCFDRAELDDFDWHLWKPWRKEGEERPPIPACIEKHLAAESGNCCQRCGSGIGLETAHIDAWSESRSHHHHNLLRLCSTCHAEHDRHGSVLTEELREIKRRAIDRTRAMLRAEMDAATGRFHPPPLDPKFVGRDEEVERFCRVLEEVRVVLVRGVGGVGKTQFVLRALEDCQDEAVVWIDMEGFQGAEDVKSALSAALEGERAETLDRMANELDARIACVVLDGVERLAGSALDDTDDLLAGLIGRTKSTRFVVTSQVNLQRTRFDHKQWLTGLAPGPSWELLQSSVIEEVDADEAGQAALLAFCEGHPLALRLTGALVEHIGSWAGAAKEVERRGARIVEIPQRSGQTRETSLEHCLSLAYDLLEPEAKRLLYVIASCPGGVMAYQLERYAGTEVPRLTAMLRRWSLVQAREAGKPSERWYALSPIRSFAMQGWSEENPTEAQAVTEALLHDFGTLAAVIALRSEEDGDIPYMLWRFSKEWPNLRLVVDAAEARAEDAELGILATNVCASTMKFLFVARLPEQGARLMTRGARIAMRDGRFEDASGYIAQAASLALRSGERRLVADVEAILEGVAAKSGEATGNLAIIRAMFAIQRGDVLAAEKHSRDAIRNYKKARQDLTAQAGEEAEDGALEDTDNNLSGGFQLLGAAPLAQGRAKDAQEAYEKALALLRGGAVAVNKGQILHQIGNCRSSLDEHRDAIGYYGRAVVQFQAVGMREYTATALGELGYAYLELDDSTSLPEALPAAVLGEGIEDAVESVVECLSKQPAPAIEDTAQSIRRLFGALVVLSLSKEVEKLREVGIELTEWTNRTLLKIAQEKDIEGSALHELMYVEALASMMLSVAALEDRAATAVGMGDEDLDALWEACASLGPVGNLESLGFQWARMYSRRRGLNTEETLRQEPVDERPAGSCLAEGHCRLVGHAEKPVRSLHVGRYA